MVVSGANNPLNAASRQEELSIGRLLARRNILFLPDWIANAGGVIHGQEEHKYGRRFSLKRVYGKIRLACQSGAREILESADRQGLIPLQAAYQKYEKVIYPGYAK
jgi:glutamate dehydrogenase/leucine dehydrogenase